MASPRYYKLVEVTGNQGAAFDHSPPQANVSRISPRPQVNGFAGQVPVAYQQQQQQQQLHHQQKQPLQPRLSPHFVTPTFNDNVDLVGGFPNAGQPLSPLGGRAPFVTPAFASMPPMNVPFGSGFPAMPSFPDDMRQQMDVMRSQMMSGAGGVSQSAFPSLGYSQAAVATPASHPQYPVVSTDALSGQRILTLHVDVSGYSPADLLINTDGECLDVYASRVTDTGSSEFRRQYQLPVAVRQNDIRCSFERDGWLVVEAFPTTSKQPGILPPQGAQPTGGLLMPANGSLARKKKRVTFSLQ